MEDNGIDTITLMALAAQLKKQADKARKTDKPAAGEFEFDQTFMVSLKGTAKLLADEDYTPTANIPMKDALALFLRYAGVTGPAAMDALVKAMTEAAEIGALPTDKAKKERRAAIREIADLDEAEKLVNKKLGELPLATRKGKFTPKVEVEVIHRGSIKPPVKTDDAASAKEIAS